MLSWKKESNTEANGRYTIEIEISFVGKNRDAKNGTRDGVGVMFWPDGSKYEGHWRRDKANGKGRIIHANGDVYYGELLFI
jgi:hypothetical protein